MEHGDSTQGRSILGALVPAVPSFEQVVLRLQRFWSEAGCALVSSMNTEVGAGTMNPATFVQVLGPRPWRVEYLEPSVRPG
jgi:glycyl-tRNA synthetase alpha subunit